MTTQPLFTNFLTGQPLPIYILNVLNFMSPAQAADVQAKTLKLDVSAAIQKAINELPANGGKLVFPNGSYLINSTVTVTANSVDLEGELGASLLVNGQTNAPCLTIGNGSVLFNRGSVSNLTFTQQSGVAATSGNVGLNVNKVSDWRFENIEVHNFPAALNQGIVFNNVSQSIVRSIGCQSCLLDGITFQGACLDLYCSQLRSDANAGSGFVISGSSGFYMLSCTAFNNTNNGWNFSGGHAQVICNMFFSQCVGDTSGSHNWSIPEMLDSTFINCWGSTQQSTGVNTASAGFFLAGSNTANIRFVGCQALNNNADGFQLFNSGGLPSGIMFDACQSGSTVNGSEGNGKSGTGWGYDLGNANNIAIIGGKVQGNATAPFNSIGGTGGRIQAVDGYNPVGASAAVVMGASPFTYTAGPSSETHYVKQSATNTATITQGGQQIAALINASTYYTIHLEPNEAYITTWLTTAPTYTKVVH